MSADEYTQSVGICERHPPLEKWPDKNLITGACPTCGTVYWNGEVLGRVLKAREIARWYRPGSAQTVEEG